MFTIDEIQGMVSKLRGDVLDKLKTMSKDKLDFLINEYNKILEYWKDEPIGIDIQCILENLYEVLNEAKAA